MRFDRTNAASLVATLAASLALLLASFEKCQADAEAVSGDSQRTLYVDSADGLDSQDGLTATAAWQSLDRVNSADLRPGDTVRFKRGGTWRGSLVPVSGSEVAPVTYTTYGNGPKPHILGSLPRSRLEDWVQVDENIWATANITDPLTVDVGNSIFDHGKKCGWKKWTKEDLENPYDYSYDGASRRVFLNSLANPATLHKSIELAMKGHIVNQSGKHHVVYDGLAVMYGASHGFGGGGTHHLVIRNCDLGYIGGAHQTTRPDGTPVRFGNAIEFWGAAHDHLVEGCRIWEVYDAALTNQGRDPSSKQVNITYRNNFIRNAEYSFEYWNHPASALTKNIRFVNNTCINAGIVWSHTQRPDQNGSHLMFYSNTAATSGIEIRHNVFYNHTEWGSRYSSGWKTLPDLDHNLWYSDRGVMVYWFREKVGGFADYQNKTGLDKHSLFAKPKFVDAAGGDYRLAPDSPGANLGPDGGPVGADMESIGQFPSLGF
jgi:hypothetical protein